MNRTSRHGLNLPDFQSARYRRPSRCSLQEMGERGTGGPSSLDLGDSSGENGEVLDAHAGAISQVYYATFPEKLPDAIDRRAWFEYA